MRLKIFLLLLVGEGHFPISLKNFNTKMRRYLNDEKHAIFKNFKEANFS